MKIVVKHVDNLISSVVYGQVIPKYLIYLMIDDSPISCDIAYGDTDMIKSINKLHNEQSFTLEVHKVSFAEHITNNY